MKKKFVDPEMEQIWLGKTDDICTSGKPDPDSYEVKGEEGGEPAD